MPAARNDSWLLFGILMAKSRGLMRLPCRRRSIWGSLQTDWRIKFQGAAASPLLNLVGVTFGDGDVPEADVDAYVRDADLVATYDELPARPIRAQVYWRRLEAEIFAPQHGGNVSAAFELIVSANTSRLDSDPRARVVSAVDIASTVSWLPLASADEPMEESRRRTIGCWLAALPGGEMSLIQMIHPLDAGESFASAVKGPPPQQQVSHRLFQVRLEKGVILRAAFERRLWQAAPQLPSPRQLISSSPPLSRR